MEKSNRTLKGPLCIRPFYSHSDQQIESQVFISLLALLVRSLLHLRCQRAGLPYSADRVLTAFAPLYATDLIFADRPHPCQLGHLTTVQQQVLAALHFPAPTHYLTKLHPGS